MVKKYVPEQGDIVFLDFDPQAGREQMGRRPALVISKREYNKTVGFVAVCPITNTQRPYPTHVALPEGNKIKGYVMGEQFKTVDYHQRKIDFVEKAELEVLDDILAVIYPIMFS